MLSLMKVIIINFSFIYNIKSSNPNQKFFRNKLRSDKSPLSFQYNKNDLKSYLLKLKEKIYFTLGKSSFEYSNRRGAHIVAQSFKYIPKELEAKEIVSYMENRQRLR